MTDIGWLTYQVLMSMPGIVVLGGLVIFIAYTYLE